MAKLDLITGPVGRVISADDIRSHARIDATDEDTQLEALSDAAEAEAEAYTWRKLLTQTWDQYYDRFADQLDLRFPPLYTTDDSNGVSSVSYTDTNGDTQTLATSVYEVAEEDGIAVVRRKYNQDWPSTRSHKDVVTVRFICGYGAVSDVPERIKQAIRLHAAHYYRHREGEVLLPEAFFRLLNPFRVNKWQPIGAA